MADIKTHLRELSVAVTAGLLLSDIPFQVSDLYDSQTFWQLAQSVIDNNISTAQNILEVPTYADELRDILHNGCRLGRAIVENSHFHFHKGDKIFWLGAQTQKGDPIDVKIGAYGFSLKENSFILENMGLYKLLNYMTGSHYQRGLHVFATFAPEEYDRWFAYTWERFVTYLQKHETWGLEKNSKVSTAYLSKGQVMLQYNGDIVSVPAHITTNRQYMSYTTSHTREKVFSKWIREQLEKDPVYLELKRSCSVAAGERVVDLIRSGYDPTSLYHFFQIHPFEYYYAKTTAQETTILRVPSTDTFGQTIQLKECRYEAPISQLNIISTFENTATHKVLEFRNECRFSHGQFNGTPEAKMYVRRDTSLAELYDPI